MLPPSHLSQRSYFVCLLLGWHVPEKKVHTPTIHTYNIKPAAYADSPGVYNEWTCNVYFYFCEISRNSAEPDAYRFDDGDADLKQ